MKAIGLLHAAGRVLWLGRGQQGRAEALDEGTTVAARWRARMLRAAGLRSAVPALAGVSVTAVTAASGLSPLLAAAAGAVAALALPRDLLAQGEGGPRNTAQPAPAQPSPAPPANPTGELLDALPLGLLLLDATGRVVFCNAAGEDMIERPVTGLMGAAALRAPALAEALAAALTRGETAEVDVTLLRSKERIIHATVTALSTPGPDGAVVVVMLEDRTRAMKAESLRRDFVANASHELRTPLASIAGFIETLQGHARNDPDAAERFLRIMAAQADRMRRLIDDLLSLNRIEINEHVLPRERVDLIGIVRETASALMPVAAAAGTSVTVDLPPGPALVRGSPDELTQLFTNLIDNAVKYGGPGGPVRVVAEGADAARPGMAGISVVDQGPGIAREHLPRLTERFYRVSNERSRERGGTGLGLAIAKHILNRHRGDLSVQSTLGAGSRFTVWLPLIPEREAAARPSVVESAR